MVTKGERDWEWAKVARRVSCMVMDIITRILGVITLQYIQTSNYNVVKLKLI